MVVFSNATIFPNGIAEENTPKFLHMRNAIGRYCCIQQNCNCHKME